MSFTYEIPHGDMPRSDSGLYSASERSYNEWQYGDEASLYSIAEDSREYGSDVFSIAGTEAAPEIPTVVVQSEVQLQWPEHDLKDDEEIDGTSHSGLSLGLIALLLLVAVLAITFGVRASKSEANNTLPVGAETPEKAPVGVPVDIPSSPPFYSQISSSPTQSPSRRKNSPSSTTAPTRSVAYELATGFVTNALSSCANTELFLNPATPQGQVFQQLVLELFEETSVDAQGFIYYPLDFGEAFIKEKFALKVLYVTTNGDEWANNMNWKKENDPCAGWHGVQNCRTRREGSCGVIEIDLASNNLSGSIPSELCCLPCLEILNLSGNSLLAGNVPACLNTGILVTLDEDLNLNSEVSQISNSP